MKKIHLLFVMTFFIFFNAFWIAQGLQNNESAKNCILKIILVGFNNDKGTANIEICKSEDEYYSSDRAFRSEKVQIKGEMLEIIFKDIPFGIYSVKVFHDENSNGKLDKNTFGIPKEQYGFSNDAKGIMGPPKYKDTSFIVNKEAMTIKITLK